MVWILGLGFQDLDLGFEFQGLSLGFGVTKCSACSAASQITWIRV
jgi:hypothetical protein